MKLVAPACALLLSACGPSVGLIPLVGDPPEIAQILEGTELPSSPAESVAAVEDFYRLLATDAEEAAWTRLSEGTQVALDQHARPLETSGRAMLRSRRFPKPDAVIPSVDGTAIPTVRVNTVPLFLVSRPTRFRSLEESKDAAVVEVENRAGERRQVKLVRERGEWRIQRTDFSDITSAISIRVRDLLSPVAVPEPTVEPDGAPDADDADVPGDTEEPSDNDSPATPDAPPARRRGGLDF